MGRGRRARGRDRGDDGAGDGDGRVGGGGGGVDVVVVDVVVQESRNGGVEIPIVGFQEETGFLLGRGGDLAEGID